MSRTRLFLLALASLVVAGCAQIPTDVTLHLKAEDYPGCPWPPPSVNDSTMASLPLGCPFYDGQGNLVVLH